MARHVETGWVIERGAGSTLEYFAVVNGHAHWASSDSAALRFARDVDAYRMRETLPAEDPMHVREHQWIAR